MNEQRPHLPARIRLAMTEPDAMYAPVCECGDWKKNHVDGTGRCLVCRSSRALWGMTDPHVWLDHCRALLRGEQTDQPDPPYQLDDIGYQRPVDAEGARAR